MFTSPISWGRTVGSLLARRSATGVAEAEQGKAFTPLADVYRLRRAYYDASQYDLLRAQPTDPRSMDALPRTVRGTLQLVKPACEWWRDNLYRGTWTADGRPSSSGKPNMVPWEDDSPDELVAAAQQLLAWGNWAERVRAYCFFGPVMGDVLLAAEVDYDRQKVYPVVYDPSYVTHLVLNGSGDVIAYRLAVPRWDPVRKQSFTWSRLITKRRVVTYYNDDEQGFSTVEDRDGATGWVADAAVPAEIENPFGFVPAAWVNHKHIGGYHGECVVDGMFRTIDELNGLQSKADDFIFLFTEQLIIVGSDNPTALAATLDAAAAGIPAATAELANPSARRGTIPVWPAPPNITVARLLENLGLGEAAVHFDRLSRNVETALPEIMVEERLSQAGDVTGPGARAIVAPVQRKLDACAPGYDHGLLKVGQMGISMTGELRRSGVFPDPNDHLAAFADFDLRSWDRGELDALGIGPRDLVPPTMLEKVTEAAAAEKLQSTWALGHAGFGNADIYGVDANGKPNEPPGPDVGILAERSQRQAEQQANAAFAASRIFDGGQA